MSIDTHSLRQKLHSASAGEWIKDSGDGWEAICSANDQANGNFIIAHFEGPDAQANREFMQAANPDTVLALLDALEAAEKRIAEQEEAIATLPPLNDDLIAILGRPNFTCSHLAELMRQSGNDIRRKSEHEQAAVIHWFLGLYLEHGDKWEGIAKADIQMRVAAAGISVKGE